MNASQTLPLEVILIDDDSDYCELVIAKLKESKHKVYSNNDSDPEAYSFESINRNYERQNKEPGTIPIHGADLIILDNRCSGKGSYWSGLIEDLRKYHPPALILLVSELSDSELKSAVEKIAVSSKKNSLKKVLFEGDPMLTYLPKPPKPKKGPPPDYTEHLIRISDIANELGKHKGGLKALQHLIFKAAITAANEIRNTRARKLIKKANKEGKGDTKVMDIITERKIKDLIGPVMHFHDVLVCTEEAGLHNELYHRISAPKFFIFSDPFDGSSGFKNLVENIIIPLSTTLAELLKIKAAKDYWKKNYGNISLNSPMVSVVLAERHRVVFAVLINLFTKNIYISTESGNYYLKNVNLTRNIKLPEPGNKRWIPFNALPLPDSRDLFLCTLKKKSTTVEEQTSHYNHADECLGTLLRTTCNWEASLEFRHKQNNFTPGPGRVLFLSDLPAADDYYKETMEGKKYASILSAGEPLTEWIGWFAFLRHMKGLSVYCLRRKGMISGRCPHKRDRNDICTLQPNEPISIFRKGFIDLEVLQTTYGSLVRSYCDTLLVAYDEDLRWRGSLKCNEEDLYERIWHLGPHC